MTNLTPAERAYADWYSRHRTLTTESERDASLDQGYTLRDAMRRDWLARGVITQEQFDRRRNG